MCWPCHPNNCYFNGPFLLSHQPITWRSWTNFFLSKWQELAKPDARILVVSGSHGGEDGSLTPNYKEDNFYNQDLMVKNWLENTDPFKSDILNKRVSIEVFHLGDYLQDIAAKRDEELTMKLREFEPSMIVLAYCYSGRSILNDVMLANGVTSEKDVRTDLYDITGGRAITTDQAQTDLLRRVVRQAPRLVFLWGSPGTGKTIMGEQAALILAGRYARRGERRWRLYVVMPSCAEELLCKMEDNHVKEPIDDSSNVTVTALEELAKDIGLTINRDTITARDVNMILKKLGEQNPGTHNILFLDEVSAGGGDWRLLEEPRKEDHLVLMVRPASELTTEAGLFPSPPASQGFLVPPRLPASAQ